MKIRITYPNSRSSVLEAIEKLKVISTLYKNNLEYIYEDVQKSDISFINLINRKKETLETIFYSEPRKALISKQQFECIYNTTVIVKFDFGFFENLGNISNVLENVYKYSNYMNDFKSMTYKQSSYINNVRIYKLDKLSALDSEVKYNGIENCILLFQNMDKTFTIIYNSAFTSKRLIEDIGAECIEENFDESEEDKYEELKRKYKRLQKKYKKLKRLNNSK